MRVIAGKYKGRNFFMPAGVRATQNLVRKALFDLLGQNLDEINFLDLFAGSGAVGIEALSRGAEKVVMVEKEPKCIKTIHENVNLLKIEPYESGRWPYQILKADAFAAIKDLAKKKRVFDIVFVDPPYGRGLAKKALKHLEAYDILQPNCIVVLETRDDENLPEKLGRFLQFRVKKYGSTYLSFYKIH